MRIISGVVPGASHLASLQELSKKPGKDSSGLTTTSLVVAILALPAATSTSAYRPSIGENDATIGDLSTLEDKAAVKEVIKFLRTIASPVRLPLASS